MAKSRTPRPYLETVVDPASGERVRRQRCDAAGRPGWRLRVRDARSDRQPERVFYGSYEDAVRALERLAGSVGLRTVRPQRQSPDLETFREAWLDAYMWKIPPTGSFPGIRRPFSTWAKARDFSQYVVRGLGPTTKMRAVATEDLTAMIAGLTRADGRPMAGHTRETLTSVVKSMFRDAVRMGVLEANPAALVPTNWGAVSLRRAAMIPSILEMEKLASALDEVWPLPRWARDLAGPAGEGRGDLLRLGSYTGMRWEEAAAVLATDVHRRRRVLTVQDTASESGGRREHRRRTSGQEAGKSRAAGRDLVIVDHAIPVIDRLDAIRRRGLELEPARNARRQARGVKRPPNRPLDERWTLLVCGEQGGFVGYSQWRKMLGLAQAKSGVDLTMHETRHIAASILIASGASDEEVREQMGHTSVDMTRRVYRHLFRVERTELARRVSARIAVLTAAELEEFTQGEDDDAWD